MKSFHCAMWLLLLLNNKLFEKEKFTVTLSLN